MALSLIETTVILDLYDHDTTPATIKAIALDSKTRYVAAVIRNGGRVYDIGADTQVTLTVLRPDGVGAQVVGEPYAHEEQTPDEQTITTYGAYAELSQTALAVKGKCLAQFKLTSGEQVLRTEIFAINTGRALDADTTDWAGIVDGHNLDEMAQSIEDLSSDVSEIQEDVGNLKEGFTDLPKIKDTEGSTAELDIADNSGNVILRLEGGDIKTKNFDSAALQADVEDLQESEAEQEPLIAKGNKNANSALSSFNPFFGKTLYYHLHQEEPSPYIPAQSLFDIRQAAVLGFDMIEANTQLCSDGVYVCKHGVGGALGEGVKDAIGSNDYSNVLFRDVTSTWIRENVVYNASLNKYCGHIPTLDEFCIECKKFGLRIKVGSVDAALVARKYMPDNMIWVTANSRGNFTGLIEYVWYKTQTVENCISACKQIGAPLNIVIAAGQFATHTDAEITQMVQAAHDNGFTVGAVYPKSPDILRAARLGVDCLGAVNNSVNLFHNGKDIHITALNDPLLVLSSGASYDSTNQKIDMTTGDTIHCVANNILCGKSSLVLRYSGTLTLSIGKSSEYYDLIDYSSDGSDYVYLANFLPQIANRTWDKWFTITASANTEIYEIACDCEVV